MGLRAIHGAEITSTRDGAPLTLLVRDAHGWATSAGCSRARTRTRGLRRRRGRAAGRAHARCRGSREAARHARRRGAHAEGLVCLSGCASRGVRDEPTMRRAAARLRARRLPGRAAAAVPPPRPRAEPRPGGAGGALGVACVATGNVHAHSAARALLQDAFVAIREHTTLDASEPLRRGNHSHVLATPEAMAARFADHPDAVAETARLAETLTFDLTSDLGYRYPGAEDGGADRDAGRDLRARSSTSRYPPGHRLRGEAPARLEEELRLIAASGCRASSSCTTTCSSSRARSPPRSAAARAARSLLPPGRGRGSSRLVDRLLPHRPLARRPDRQRPAARALPQRGDHDAARHRPRLPARRARGPDPARARALRARPLGARGRVPDLPGARRDPRDRQGAGPAAGGDRAGRARRRRVVAR